MGVVNLGILAHVDAGKTTLTERLLFEAGVVAQPGSVDDGTTQTDSLSLERQRGITIKAAVVSFLIGDLVVNLVDTPGHPDFIAEVERVLSLLDGAVLVVSAVEGVQAQTRVLMRVLRRLGIPTLIFVNKVDRMGADCARTLRHIESALSPSVVAMDRDPAAWVDLLSQHDDGILAEFVAAGRVRDDSLRAALRGLTGRGLVHPVFFGSAATGDGIGQLTDGVAHLLPTARDNLDGPATGTVFKVDRGPAGEKIAYVRMFSGQLQVRDRLLGDRVTGIALFDRGTTVRQPTLPAGRIGQVWGLTGVRIGDRIGATAETADHLFAPPTLETVVLPDRPADRGALHAALTELAEQDPLISLREEDQEIALSLYGEVQKEVIEATLADSFDLAVTFRETTTIHIERPVGTGEAVEAIGKDGNPFLATVGLRVEPGEPGTGVMFQLGVELGSMPYAFFKAVEDTVTATLQQGLYGWQVPDCVVTMTHSGYCPRQSHAHGRFDKSMSSTGWDFRYVTPLVLLTALQRGGTAVHEPMHRFTIDIPADTVGSVLPAVARLGGAVRTSTTTGASCVLVGEIPAVAVHGLQRQLPSLTRGEALPECVFDHYRPVRGTPPIRRRQDHNPLNRKEYLLHVLRRV
ncbi:MAG TPA: translation factor GTPase family protein [Pseudonocardiaceae bacterium]|nr:translation factor GTPase family protein [Pseudonocardiaceae bacterium]